MLRAILQADPQSQFHIVKLLFPLNQDQNKLALQQFCFQSVSSIKFCKPFNIYILTSFSYIQCFCDYI